MARITLTLHSPKLEYKANRILNLFTPKKAKRSVIYWEDLLLSCCHTFFFPLASFFCRLPGIMNTSFCCLFFKRPEVCHHKLTEIVTA